MLKLVEVTAIASATSIFLYGCNGCNKHDGELADTGVPVLDSEAQNAGRTPSGKGVEEDPSLQNPNLETEKQLNPNGKQGN